MEDHMNRLTIAMGLLLLLADGAVKAQNDRSSANTDRSSVQAPVGHRQPRPDEVPSEKNLSNPQDQANKEDAALDKKIKSICRGC
jgi:hypothetical protein